MKSRCAHRHGTGCRPLPGCLLALLVGAGSVQAGEVAILAAEFSRDAAGTWSARVTLEHGDTGWDHYADAWRVVAPDGTVLGTRTLHHPHETEQPFTRGLPGIAIPATTGVVWVEAHDKVHGWSSMRLEVDLSAAVNGRVRAER